MQETLQININYDGELNMDYGKEIGLASANIRSIGLNFEKPFTWASGYRMPIYNDNRMLLANYEHRQLVKNGLVELIENSGEKPEFILGTATAGIAPAAMVARELGLPLIIFNEGKAYELQGERVRPCKGFDAAASTCPWAIPYGVNFADEMKIPFMYVRQSAKAHGKEQQIEGIPIEGQNAMLFNFYNDSKEDYGDLAVSVLETKGVNVLYTASGYSDFFRVDLKGKKGIAIEDLISTGGSSAKEVKAGRDAGAEINLCLSIFEYALLEAQNEFNKYAPGTKVDSVLRYPKFLETAKEIDYWNEKEILGLEDWRADPFNWGEKHGFPKVDKK